MLPRPFATIHHVWFENYGRNLRFRPTRVVIPSKVDELQQAMKKARTLRVMGARHSWSGGIVTDGTLVSLEKMNRVLHIDRKEMRVTAEAGMRLMDLIVELEQHGLALENLGSIAEQSLAGAISTGTHGTGIGFRCLADQVQSISLVDGQGEIRVIDRDHPDFSAVAVSFGAFGVIYEMTLSVVPAFQIHAITELMSFDELIENLDEHVRAHDHFKFWWLVPQDRVIVFRQRRTDEPRNDSDIKRWFKDEFLGKLAYRSLLAMQKVERKRMSQLTNRIIGSSYGKRYERTCKSHVAYLTPEPPPHAESEWAFDYGGAVDLLREYRRLLTANGHAYSFIQELRFSAADDFWASPSYGRDSIWLSHYNIDRPAAWDEQLSSFLSFARDHGGRPHWGKHASFDPDYLLNALPKLGAFASLRGGYDPEDRLANPWLRRVLGLPEEGATQG
jgi:hypothetical protein